MHEVRVARAKVSLSLKWQDAPADVVVAVLLEINGGAIGSVAFHNDEVPVHAFNLPARPRQNLHGCCVLCAMLDGVLGVTP